ncbi:biotin--[acetyl-CoA-carboxylase] ligase [Streptomyces sp. P38-E01]|uniref:biotin--[biotin carboxyl-carrier protein] ligase n=1 Tax=Streptomyces tardus TaxID=2780544 RepID=A0A949JDS5_9ACTN|nr:biotin--[acetyl-CoA-carboxylase] ligase [Streptomyces tardus]MBU7596685.1 biotin--[acetyl-CoA-carboxylase] ligase [Streptomyces tardus]
MKPNSSGNGPRPGPAKPTEATAPGPWTDLDRPPLNAVALRRALLSGGTRPDASGADPRAGGLWTDLEIVEETGSTNSDLVRRLAHEQVEEGTVLVAERQVAGRGRLDRGWNAPARSGIFVSVVLRPGADIEPHRLGWMPLLAGVATATALARTAGVDTALKWPNDLLAAVDGEERKIGGILAERIGDRHSGAVVLGIGLNVTLRADELPVPQAGSLRLAGAVNTDRDPLLRAVLRSVEEWYGKWRDAEGDAAACGLLETYSAGCATLGRQVRAELPGGSQLVGEAVAIDGDGRLVLNLGDGVLESLDAGDIVHLRPGG